MAEFFFQNFCRPMIDPGVQGYNFVNTTVYAAILLLIVWFGIIPFLKKKEIPINYKFALAVLPYVAFGAGLRVMNDTGVFQKTCNPLELGFFTFTPGIWFLTAAIAILGLLAAKKLSDPGNNYFMRFGGIGKIIFAPQIDFYSRFAAIGIIFAAPVLAIDLINFVAWEGFLLTIAGIIAITSIVKFAVEKAKKDFFADKLNLLVVAGQAIDGTSTFVATQLFNCGEQHPLSATILGFNPVLFLAVKLALALLIVHYVDKDIEDKRLAAFIKVAVMILGFATGGRNLITLGAGTCL